MSMPINNNLTNYKQITACHFNSNRDSNSLKKYINHCRAYFSENFYHIIAVTETWFTAGFTDRMAQIQNYNILRNDRLDRIGGGVALYIHKSLNYRLLSFSNN